MFGIGFTEMIVLAGIALVVIGPERFPDVAKTFIRTVRDLRGHWDDLSREFTKEMRPMEKELKQLTRFDEDTFKNRPRASSSWSADAARKQTEMPTEAGEKIPGQADDADTAPRDYAREEDQGPYPYVESQDSGSETAAPDTAPNTSGDPDDSPPNPEPHPDDFADRGDDFEINPPSRLD